MTSMMSNDRQILDPENNSVVARCMNGDCVQRMSEIETDSVDMILTDLPYGMTKNKWDVPIPFNQLWEQYKRVVKPSGAVVLFGNNPFTAQLICSNAKDFRYTLVWEKNKSSDFLNSKRKPLKIHEDICVFYAKQPTYNPQFTFSTPYKRHNTQQAVDKQTNYGAHKANAPESKDGRRYPTTVLKFNRIERPAHPTQKPVPLLAWLIRTYTNSGDCVLDSCMGSGSTGVACMNEGRQFIGIEQHEEYYTKAVEWIQSAGNGVPVAKRARLATLDAATTALPSPHPLTPQ